MIPMRDNSPVTTPNPPSDCPLCPRLVEFRHLNQAQFPDWHNAPVNNWGDTAPSLLIVGLAPGLRGANRTGRPFTGDYAGDLLYDTLKMYGLARGQYRADPNDGFELVDTMIVNSVRCVPPQNKPTGPEIATCRRFLIATLAANPQAKAYFALGRIGHDSLLSALGERRASFPFSHGAEHRLSDGRTLIDSFHCSRYNTNTGRLTPEMFESAMGKAVAVIRG